jgi:hypothetical protein
MTGARRTASIEAAKRRVRDDQFYFIRRHGSFFRPGAHGYCDDIAGAGVFDGATARNYLDVEGLSLLPLRSMRKIIKNHIVTTNHPIPTMKAGVATMQAMLRDPASFANGNQKPDESAKKTRKARTLVMPSFSEG